MYQLNLFYDRRYLGNAIAFSTLNMDHLLKEYQRVSVAVDEIHIYKLHTTDLYQVWQYGDGTWHLVAS